LPLRRDILRTDHRAGRHQREGVNKLSAISIFMIAFVTTGYLLAPIVTFFVLRNINKTR